MSKKQIVLVFTSLSLSFSAQAQSTKTAASKAIPKLNVKAEEYFNPAKLVLQLPAQKNYIDLQLNAKKSPDLVVVPTDIKLMSVDPVKVIVSPESIAQIPLVKALDFVADPLITEPQTNLKNLVEIKPDEFKMIQALIFLDYQKKYDLAMPLFVELMGHPEYKNQAIFHYAQTALGLKLFSEFREKMIQVSKEAKDPTIKKLAIETIVKNIQHLQVSDIELIEPLAKTFEVDTINYPAYLLKKAKYYSAKGNLVEFESALLMIPSTASEYNEGTLLKAVLNYRRGDLDTALQTLEFLWPTIEVAKKDQIRNLTALTLARLYFQKAEYKTAYKYYLSVDKSSGQWLQSMVEQAWTQILAGDNEGAAGNMFSLHTDFFQKAYAPDTYVVRTVGYLNLCQYGDGVHVLEDLNKKYKSISDKLETYQKNNKDPLSYYDLVKTFLKNSKQDEFDGVPRSFVVELARHPNYMNFQTQINNYEDENNRFNKLTIDLIRKEREARLQMLKAKNEYAQAGRDGKKGDGLLSLEKKFLARGVEHLIYSRAREGIKKMREAAVARLLLEENKLRGQAAKNLQARFTDLVGTLNHLVDQQEVLTYEIYSGAGEHIRFQMAGGETNPDRAQASLTPDDKENYKWKFKGEVWDDELGHYRSSLKNVCPKDEIAVTNNEQ